MHARQTEIGGYKSTRSGDSPEVGTDVCVCAFCFLRLLHIYIIHTMHTAEKSIHTCACCSKMKPNSDINQSRLYERELESSTVNSRRFKFVGFCGVSNRSGVIQEEIGLESRVEQKHVELCGLKV